MASPREKYQLSNIRPERADYFILPTQQGDALCLIKLLLQSVAVKKNYVKADKNSLHYYLLF